MVPASLPCRFGLSALIRHSLGIPTPPALSTRPLSPSVATGGFQLFLFTSEKGCPILAPCLLSEHPSEICAYPECDHRIAVATGLLSGISSSHPAGKWGLKWALQMCTVQVCLAAVGFGRFFFLLFPPPFFLVFGFRYVDWWFAPASGLGLACRLGTMQVHSRPAGQSTSVNLRVRTPPIQCGWTVGNGLLPPPLRPATAQSSGRLRGQIGQHSRLVACSHGGAYLA